MAIYCMLYDFIIPISNIDKIYDGGFNKFKLDHAPNFGKRYWHDAFLFRDGAMNPYDIDSIGERWENLGLIGLTEVDGQTKFNDFCVIESMFSGLTYPCDWIVFDRKTKSAYLRGKPKGKIIGPNV